MNDAQPTPGAALEQPAKSQVTPSDSTGTLPPAWATAAGRAIRIFQKHAGLYLDEELGQIIVEHAPPPVPVSPPTYNSDHMRHLITQALARTNAKSLQSRAEAVMQAIGVMLAQPVSPPCKEREELVENLELTRQFLMRVEAVTPNAFMPHNYSIAFETLTDAITFISGAAAVARKDHHG